MSSENFKISRLEGASRIEVEKSGVFTYVGVAQLGSSRSDIAWSIQRIENTTTGNSIKWAEGNANFDKIMNNYLLYTYS